MKTKEIPSIIHLVCLPPYTIDKAKYNLEVLSVTHPNFDIMIHTELLEDSLFKNLPVFGPEQLSSLVRMEVLKRYGGWYFDLDVHIHCDLKKLEKTLNIGNNLTVSMLGNSGVCTFASCCPENWSKWDVVNQYILEHPKSARGHYCTGVLGKLLKEKPHLCDYLPRNFVYSNTWLNHKGIGH